MQTTSDSQQPTALAAQIQKTAEEIDTEKLIDCPTCGSRPFFHRNLLPAEEVTEINYLLSVSCKKCKKGTKKLSAILIDIEGETTDKEKAVRVREELTFLWNKQKGIRFVEFSLPD